MPSAPYYHNSDGTIYCGDARRVLQSLPARSVHCCVTSPPYFGLRKYGAGEGEIGIEEHAEVYIGNMIAVANGVQRVLRDDGTFFLNVGDGRVGRKDGGINLVSWQLAQALEKWSWVLLEDIIWHKTNPVPDGSTFRRCTRSHEYVLVFIKRGHHKEYFYDGVGIKNASGSNRHTVWDIPVRGYPGHRAVFPEELARLCIQAGTSDGGCCAQCGKPSERIIQKVGGKKKEGVQCERDRSYSWSRNGIDGSLDGEIPKVETLGWRLTCDCPGDKEGPDADIVRPTVLDPFLGSGTTAVVARRLGRIFVGAELNQETLDKVTIPRLAKDSGQQGGKENAPGCPRASSWQKIGSKY